MIEYIYDVIKASAGQEFIVTAKITTENGTVPTGCHFNLYDGENKIATHQGTCANGVYEFIIPAETTAKLRGRYWYCICDEKHSTLNFRKPIYFE